MLGLLLPFFCSRAPAQIVNIEDKRVSYDSSGWYGTLDLGGQLTRNQNTVVTLNGALRLDRVGRRSEQLLLADYRLVQVSGQNALNTGFGHYRYGYDLGPDWRWETFGQLQYNEQIRLRLRALLGSGLRRRLLEREFSRAYLGTLLMYEYDEVAAGQFIYQDLRLSAYLTGTVRLLPGLQLSNTTYYQPVLFLGEARLSSVTGVELSVSRRLSATSTYSITRDARLARELTDVPVTTYFWKNGLRWRF